MRLKKYLIWYVKFSSRRHRTGQACSFCSESCPKLITGPIGTNICSRCLDICVEIISHNPIKPGEERRSASSGEAPLRCSFCGKNQDEVAQLVAGPTVYICNECVTHYVSSLRAK